MNTQAAIIPRQLRVGLIGAGIDRSLTPAMHMREGEYCGLSYQYDLIDLEVRGLSVSDLSALIDQAEAAGYSGLNITHPCKQAAVALVDELSPDAQALRSINTIVFDGGRRIGHNTDWWGFAESFRRGLDDVSLDRVVQLGAGGAGVAVAHAVAQMGARSIEIFDLDQSRAQALADQLKPAHAACSFSVSHRTVGFITCTVPNRYTVPCAPFTLHIAGVACDSPAPAFAASACPHAPTPPNISAPTTTAIFRFTVTVGMSSRPS